MPLKLYLSNNPADRKMFQCYDIHCGNICHMKKLEIL